MARVAVPDAWLARLDRPTDTAALVALRMLVGSLLFIGSVRFVFNGWVERFFAEPTFFFKYWGFSWVVVWPLWGMYVHFACLAVLGLCIAAGLFYRASVVLAFVGFTYLELMDVSYYLNHYYLLSLLLLLLAGMPLGWATSIDALRKPERALRSFPAWCTVLLRFQIAVVYFYAGLAKVGSDWLVHAQPMGIWLSARTHMPLVGPWLGEHTTALVASWAGCFYDLTIWMWLSWRRTRLVAFAVVVAFHVIVGWTFNIGIFPLIMIASATVFLSPSWPTTLLNRKRVWQPPPTHPRADRRVLAVAAAFALVQLVVPLRHLLYSGNVLWNEQGMRWAWKVLVREKNGAVTYHVTLPNGRRHIVTPRRYLTDFQEREMSGQPDLILQLAHHIAADYRQRGHGEVAVRAETRVSLNGRPAVALIDPNVDLARVADGVFAAPWIAPAPTTLPVRLTSLRPPR